MEVRDKNSNNDRPEDAASDSNKLRWQRSSTSTVITDQGYEEKDKRMIIPDPSIVPIDLTGMLHKQGRLFKAWKQRYFEIQGSNMYYYKTQQKEECLGYIGLTKLYYIGKSTAASFGSSFELQTPNRIHLLAARNEEDRSKWITMIHSKMLPDARIRQTRGNKADVHAVKPVLDSRGHSRATIKLSRSDRRVPSSRSAYTLTQHENIEGAHNFHEFSTHNIDPSTDCPSTDQANMKLSTMANSPATATSHLESSLPFCNSTPSSGAFCPGDDFLSPSKNLSELSYFLPVNTLLACPHSDDDIYLPPDNSSLPSPLPNDLLFPTLPFSDDLQQPSTLLEQFPLSPPLFVDLATSAKTSSATYEDNLASVNASLSLALTSAIDELRLLIDYDDESSVNYEKLPTRLDFEPSVDAVEQLKHFLRVCP